MNENERPVMILAGGTGGHVYPALAVVRSLMTLGIPVVWMGTREGLEARVVPAAGVPIEWLSVSGLRGKGIWTWLLAPIRLNIAFYQALIILLRRKPRAVLGMGGFVAGPGALMAFILSKPLVIHEQNAIAGLTNRVLASLCDRLLAGFPGAFNNNVRVEVIGNPVREEIAAITAPEERLANRAGPLRLLVVGGSLGAQALNEIVPAAIKRLTHKDHPQITHQTGCNKSESTKQAYQQAGIAAEVTPFIEDMAAVYQWADLVLCRAGALTIAELTGAGIGAILVPYPHAVDDHQTANGRFLEKAGAALVVQQAELTAERLGEMLQEFANNRERLLRMAVAARRQATPQAAQNVARICLEAAEGSNRQGGKHS